MAKPKYYLKPFWMVRKQTGLKPDTDVIYGISKKTWNWILNENKIPIQVNKFECIINYKLTPYYFKPVYLTKRLSMESKNIKRG